MKWIVKQSYTQLDTLCMKSTTKCVQIDVYAKHIIHISLEFIIHTYKALESEITNRLINQWFNYISYINPSTKEVQLYIEVYKPESIKEELNKPIWIRFLRKKTPLCNPRTISFQSNLKRSSLSSSKWCLATQKVMGK